MLGTPYPKEQMHRIAYTKLTKKQISDKLNPIAKRGPGRHAAADRLKSVRHPVSTACGPIRTS